MSGTAPSISARTGGHPGGRFRPGGGAWRGLCNRARARSRAWSPLRVALLATLVHGTLFWTCFRGYSRVHDGFAYRLQAQMLLEGRWAMPAHPLPEFFDAFHVLSQPVYMSKYYPGYALVLAPFEALGAAWLAPPLLAGAFVVVAAWGVRPLTSRRGARLVAWAIAGSPFLLVLSRTYVASALSGLAAWAGVGALLRVWQGAAGARRGPTRARWLWLAGGCACLTTVTRPIDTLVVALPLGVWGLVRALRRRLPWPALLAGGGAAGAGAALGILLLAAHSRAALGRWHPWPYDIHSARYFPCGHTWHAPGIEPPPEIEAAPFLARYYREVEVPSSRAYTVAHAAAEWATSRVPITLGAVALFLLWRPVPLLELGAAGRRRRWPGPWHRGLVPALATAVWLVYLPFRFFNSWYLAPVFPAWALLLGNGLRRAWICGMRRGAAGTLFVRGGLILTLAGLLHWAVVGARAGGAAELAAVRRLDRALAAVPPEQAAVVFVRRAADASVHQALVWNGPRIDAQRIVLAHDLGARNAELMAYYGAARAAYLYDEAAGALLPLAPRRATAKSD